MQVSKDITIYSRYLSIHSTCKSQHYTSVWLPVIVLQISWFRSSVVAYILVVVGILGRNISSSGTRQKLKEEHHQNNGISFEPHFR